MPKIVYRNTPYTYPLSDNIPGTVILDPAVMKDWNVKNWQDVLASMGFQPEPPPFIPTFRLVFRSFLGSAQVPMDHSYFASAETAQWLSNKYGTGEVIRKDSAAVSWACSVTDQEYHIRLKNGELVNAGFLATIYEDNPEDNYPGLADRMIRTAIGSI